VQCWRNDHAGNLVLDFETAQIDVRGVRLTTNESAVGDLR
jgi:hypothetical protein